MIVQGLTGESVKGLPGTLRSTAGLSIVVPAAQAALLQDVTAAEMRRAGQETGTAAADRGPRGRRP